MAEHKHRWADDGECIDCNTFYPTIVADLQTRVARLEEALRDANDEMLRLYDALDRLDAMITRAVSKNPEPFPRNDALIKNIAALLSSSDATPGGKQ